MDMEMIMNVDFEINTMKGPFGSTQEGMRSSGGGMRGREVMGGGSQGLSPDRAKLSTQILGRRYISLMAGVVCGAG